jgi:hypothetical protein
MSGVTEAAEHSRQSAGLQPDSTQTQHRPANSLLRSTHQPGARSDQIRSDQAAPDQSRVAVCRGRGAVGPARTSWKLVMSLAWARPLTIRLTVVKSG